MIEFDDFVAKSGESGGWHPDDHAVYLKGVGRSDADSLSPGPDLAACLFHIHPSEIEAHNRSAAQHHCQPPIIHRSISKMQRQPVRVIRACPVLADLVRGKNTKLKILK